MGGTNKAVGSNAYTDSRNSGGQTGRGAGAGPALRGQSAVFIALSILLLVAVVGLAVDGGSMYAEHRKAQNAADSGAMAATRLMLSQFEAALLDPNNNGNLPGTAAQEDAIRSSLEQYVAANKVVTDTIEAYFVNRNKQIVTAVIGEDHGQGHCGVARPCQVGENGMVPWNIGAVGITVKTRSETGSFFMGALGWNTVASAARATAFIGVTTTTGNIAVQPIALYTRTVDINNIQFDTWYTLLDGDVQQGSGNWGWVNFNGQASSSTVIEAWFYCGFNPSVDANQWVTSWCPSPNRYQNAAGYGPTRHYVSANTPSYDPANTPTYVPYLKYGPGSAGWWVEASSGAVNSSCQEFQNMVQSRATNTPDGNGVYLNFPIFDEVRQPSGGSTLRYHLRAVARFFIRPTDVSCRPNSIPTPTPCAGCPTPTPTNGNSTRWLVVGKAKNFYESSGSGELGDIRRAFFRTVFLDP